MKDIFGASLVAAACVVCAGSVQAQQAIKAEQYNFKVEPGPLNRVIAELAAQARASVSVGTVGEVDVRINGVVGTHTLKDALEAALAGSGWKIKANSDRTFQVVREGDNVVTLDAVVITARRNDFARTTSSLLTRTETPLRQTPGTVDSVTEEVLQSQNAISVYEALRNIPGALFSSSNGKNSVIIGQEIAGDLTYTNGLQGSRVARNPPVTDIESIEVLKGPASILAGASISSGTINYVPKRATGRSAADIGVALGSGSERSISADVGGAIAREQGLFWRLAVLDQEADHLPNGGNDPHQRVVNPMLGYRSENVTFDASLQHYTKRTPTLSSAAYEPATQTFKEYGARLSPDAGDTVASSRLSYNLEVDLAWNDNYSLTLRNKGLYQDATYKGRFQFPLTYDFMGMGSMLLAASTINHDRQVSEYLDLYAKFKTGNVEHQLILATDLAQSSTNRADNQDIGFATDSLSPALLPLPFDKPGSLTRVHQYSVVLQDQMNMGRFHALLGLRNTNYKSTPYTWDAAGAQWVSGTAISEAHKLLANAGLVYDLSKAVSAYVSYTNAFSPLDNGLQTSSGQTLPPTTRTQYEIGVKSGLLDDRMTLNVSTYQFTTDNSATVDPANPLFYVPGPGLKGKGYEVSLSGSVTPTLKLLAGYTYSTSNNAEGAPVTGIPNRVANLWAVKTFKLVNDQTIDVGLGGNYNSGFNSQSFLDGTYYTIDRKFVTMNGSIAYTNGRYSVNAFVNNILDRKNYQPSTQIGQIQIDAPRSLRVDFRAKF